MLNVCAAGLKEITLNWPAFRVGDLELLKLLNHEIVCLGIAIPLTVRRREDVETSIAIRIPTTLFTGFERH